MEKRRFSPPRGGETQEARISAGSIVPKETLTNLDDLAVLALMRLASEELEERGYRRMEVLRAVARRGPQ